VLFAGDAAHRVSPFGARGANSGVQDTDNLGWKLDLVMRGLAPDTLMDTYAQERELAADENILNSTRSTDFITPKSEISLLFRNTVLRLAKNHDFARKLVNSGRLSTPTFYTESPLNTPDTDDFALAPPLGAVAPDAPVRVDGKPAWWLEQLDGRFVIAVFCHDTLPPAALIDDLTALLDSPLELRVVLVLGSALADNESKQLQAKAWSNAKGLSIVADTDSVLAARYGIQANSCYLIRPDQHIAARWRHADLPTIQAALRRATGSHVEVSSCPV
jgi:3-(3-hydroxy-phenyl)propionate hydroxylase